MADHDVRACIGIVDVVEHQLLVSGSFKGTIRGYTISRGGSIVVERGS
jgi:hypothetical protein